MASRPRHCAARRIIVGIGQDYRRDDAVGLVAARRLETENPQGLHVHCLGDDLLRLVDLLEPHACVVVIDAVMDVGTGAAKPGTLICLDLLGATTLPTRASPSSHGVDLLHVLALADALGRKPATLWLVGVTVADVAVGTGLSPAVETAVDEAVRAARTLSGAQSVQPGGQAW